MALTPAQKKVRKAIGDVAFIHCFKETEFSGRMGDLQRAEEMGQYAVRQKNSPFGSGFYAVSPNAFAQHYTGSKAMEAYFSTHGFTGLIGVNADGLNLFVPKDYDTVLALEKLVGYLDIPPYKTDNKAVQILRLNLSGRSTSEYAQNIDKAIEIIQMLRKTHKQASFIKSLDETLKRNQKNYPHKTEDYILRELIYKAYKGRQHQLKMEKGKSAETVFTHFMKPFCDGIDVRAMKDKSNFDNYATGSVLFRIPEGQIKTEKTFNQLGGK